MWFPILLGWLCKALTVRYGGISGYRAVLPFFLGPGKHWTQDIPRLAAEAAARHAGVHFHVAPTLGIDDLILDLLDKRLSHCVEHEFVCDSCRGTVRCGL